MVFVTLKMPKSLINNEIRAARPGGSKPPPSLGEARSSRKKVVEGVFCCSVRVRATKRQRRIFSLWRSHVSDRGERSREARSSRKKVVEGAYCRFVIVRAAKRRRRKFSLGRCHDSDRGERTREARSSRKKWSRELSAVLRACERPNVRDVYSPWGEVTLVTEGRETARPEARAKSGRGSLLLFCASASDQTSETYVLPGEMSRQ